MKKILIEISPAEFLDRLSIINIKLKNIKNPKMEVRIKKAKTDLFSGNLEQFNIMNADTYVRKMYLALQDVNRELYDNHEFKSGLNMIQVVELNESKEAMKSKIDSHLKS